MRRKSVRAAAARESASLKNPVIVRRALVRAALRYFNLQGSVLAVTGLGWNLILSTVPARRVPAAAGHSIGAVSRIGGGIRIAHPKNQVEELFGFIA